MKRTTRYLMIGILLPLLYACTDETKKISTPIKPLPDIEIKKTENPIEQPKEDQEVEVSKHSPVIENDPQRSEYGIKKLLSMPAFVQENGFYCAPAVLQSILEYNGIMMTQTTLAQQLHSDPVTGSEYEDIARVLNQNLFQIENPTTQEDGYHVQTLDTIDEQSFSTWEKRMQRNIDSNYASILAIDLNLLYRELPSANHVILCVGYQKDSTNENVLYYYILDPYEKVQDPIYGGLKIFTPKELWNAIYKNIEPAYLW